MSDVVILRARISIFTPSYERKNSLKGGAVQEGALEISYDRHVSHSPWFKILL